MESQLCQLSSGRENGWRESKGRKLHNKYVMVKAMYNMATIVTNAIAYVKVSKRINLKCSYYRSLTNKHLGKAIFMNVFVLFQDANTNNCMHGIFMFC